MSEDSASAPVVGLTGLTGQEAAQRLSRDGPNEAREERRHPLLELARHFWGPVPWMLELTIVLEFVLGRRGEGVVIAALLAFNAVVGRLQEGRARNALEILRQRLQVQARTRRDGRWQLVPARELVVGDVVHLRMGDVAPADVMVKDGEILVDQSALTGESLPVDVGPEKPAFAGTVVRRGEATGVVTATGTRTVFGKTAELVRLAKTKSHLETVIFAIVKYLVLMDVVLVGGVLVYALLTGRPMAEVLPFALILLVASVPVALPATFTVATAVGATELVGEGVLVTRLAAIEEAAGMDVLCSDKTGTITLNQLSVTALVACPPYTEAQVLERASVASDESTQDPIDLAIVQEARARGVATEAPAGRRFIPFDSATKRSEGIVPGAHGDRRVVKGTPATVLPLAGAAGAALAVEVDRLGGQGARVLAVVEGEAGEGNVLQPVGLIGLADPPRPDAAQLIGHLRELGVRVAMVTGDAESTALVVAHQVGIGERVCPVETLRQAGDGVLQHDVFAGVLPEDKFHLVQAFQRHGHTTGMTGDGVNDAPALKQAEVGIAVSSATDVAKAAASLVLTNPGLGNVVAAVRTSRRIYQRMVTYTLNKIIKTCEISLLLSVGLMLTGTFVTTPTLIVLLLFTNDFVTMAIATDRTTVPAAPTRWRIGPLMRAALTLASLILVMSFGVFFFARTVLELPLAQLQTLMFVLLVFSGQGTVYLVREHRYFWCSRPSRWLLGSSVADVLVVGAMASLGILMAPIPLWLLAATLGLVVVYLTGVDLIKVRLMRMA
jgi:H+-transporting ATPase